MVRSVPGLQLQCPFLSRNLKGVRIIIIVRLCHLQAVNADTCANRKLLSHQAELWNAVQQHVVDLWEKLIEIYNNTFPNATIIMTH